MKKIFVVAALFTSSQLIAQDSTTTLNEVVVTANKFPNKTLLTGKVVTIISRQDIEHSGSRDLSQILNEQGGIYINGANNNPGKDKSIYVRGGRAEHTLIAIDGVPVYDASGIGSNFDIRNISIDNIERIEILKGSQGTLYGSDAIAGVINIITRKSGVKPFSVYGMASAGSFSTIRANAGIAGKTKNADYTIGYTFFDTKGISEAAQPANSTETFDKDGSQQNSLQATIGVQACSALRVQPYIRYSKNKGDFDLQGYVDEPNYTYRAENLQAGVRNEIDIRAAKINVLYNYTKTDRFYSTSDQSSYKGNEHFAEAFVVYPFHTVKLTAGVDFRASNATQTSTSPYIKPFVKDSVKQTQFAAYSALNFSKNAFNLEAGGRFNNHSEYGSNLAYNVNPSYLFHQQWKVFANISSGYKTPSLYQLFSEYGNRQLDPETSVNLEVGLHYFTKDERSSIRAAYFRRHVKDVMAFLFNPASFQLQYINQDEQKDYGIEVDARMNLNDKIQAKVFYSFADGELTTKNAGKDTSYFNLYRRPKSILTLQLGSQVTRAFYVNASIQSVMNTKDITFDPPLYVQRDLKLKDYILVNLYAEYALVKHHLKIFTDLRNVTDEQYASIYGYNSPRFNAYGGMRFSF